VELVEFSTFRAGYGFKVKGGVIFGFEAVELEDCLFGILLAEVDILLDHL
jgi:hypothetical protein